MMGFVIVVALLNLALGYYLAVRLGYGPPGLIEAWGALVAPTGGEASAPADEQDTPAEPAAEATDEATEQPQEAEPARDESGGPSQESVEPPHQQDQAHTEQPATEQNDAKQGAEPTVASDAEGEHARAAADQTGDQLAAERTKESAEEDQPADQTPAPSEPDEVELDEKYVEASILRLNIAIRRSAECSAEIDARLRACRGQTDEETVADCARLLEEDCRTYLAAQEKAAEQLRQRVDEFGELSDLADKIEMAHLEQAAQIETTLNNLKNMDLSTDLEAANERLRAELGKLRQARDRLRDQQEGAFLAVARHQQRLDKIEPRLCDDPLTGLPNRIGLEVTLEQWWEEGRARTRSITMGLFDINAFTDLNLRYGAAVADRVLGGLGRLLQAISTEMDLVGRFSGQQFLVVKLDEGARAAIRRMESMRQAIERSTFRAEEQEIPLTVSAGYTAVSATDSLSAVMERLNAALKEAKQAGPNSAFFHDGQRIEQIESPHLGAKVEEVAV